MTSRPRIIEIKRADPSVQKSNALAHEHGVLQEKIAKLKSEVVLNETLAKKILADAHAEATQARSEVERWCAQKRQVVEAELAQARAREEKECQLLRAETDQLMASAEALSLKTDQEWKRIEDAHAQLKERSVFLSDWEKRLKLTAEKQALSQTEIARESADLSRSWQELKAKETTIDEILEGLTLREQGITEREGHALELERRGQGELQAANQKFLQIQGRESELQSRELALKNLERRLEVESQEHGQRMSSLRARESSVTEREKNCDIREAQLRARMK